MPKFTAVLRTGKAAIALASALCVVTPCLADAPAKSFTEMVRKFVLVPAGEPETEMLAKTTAAVNFIQRMELPQASRAVNEALQLAPRNSQLHFLNGFVYHLQAKQGDGSKNDMSIEGYQQALRLDPSNWIAQEFLGLAYLDLRKFEQARSQFSEVLLMTPDSTVSVHGLMVASYMTGDAVTACAMADQFQKISHAPHAEFIRSSIAVYASCGEFGKAGQMRKALGDNKEIAARVDRRVAQWQSLYANKAPGLVPANLNGGAPGQGQMLLAQAFNVPGTSARPPSRPEPAAVGKAAAPAVAISEQKPVVVQEILSGANPRMILVDVVMVSAQELVSTSKGVNLLSALTLQLGAIVGNVAAFSDIHTYNNTATAAATMSTAITRAVTIPALAYSLNIANANNSVNEVLARPTLAAIEGMPSEFFSGTNLSAGVVSLSSQGGTTIVPLEKRFGIKLAVTPTFLSNGRVQLKVDALRTSLNANLDNPKVAYQIETGEISANANVVMRMGDTLVLSGLSEKSTASTREGVPLLQDVPLVQYVFSNKRTNDIQRSVLILITPRAPAYTATVDDALEPAANLSVQALRDKFGFTGAGAANVDAVLAHLTANTLFREFREGDVMLERWDRAESTGFRLLQSLEFLYY
jgi:pilus assembly protein CpaC